MKLQPNFSWQKYERKPEDQKEQFQYQLQTQHILVANSINTTIDDASYFTRERQTAFTWIDNRPIYTKSFTGTITGSAVTAYPIGSTICSLISIEGTAQNANPVSNFAIPIPFINNSGDNIGVFCDATNFYIDAFNGVWSNYQFFITLKYTKA